MVQFAKEALILYILNTKQLHAIQPEVLYAVYIVWAFWKLLYKYIYCIVYMFLYVIYTCTVYYRTKYMSVDVLWWLWMGKCVFINVHSYFT